MTLYISDTDTNSKRPVTTSFVYLLVSLFCVLFGAVYEMFSHEVYSFFMIYAFIFPLAGGTLPFLIMELSHKKRFPDTLSRNLYHSGIGTLTVGSIMQGVLDIYGTTNSLIKLYWLIGAALIVASAVSYFAFMSLHREKQDKIM